MRLECLAGARSAELRRGGGWILWAVGSRGRADEGQDELTASLLSCPQSPDHGTAFDLVSVPLQVWNQKGTEKTGKILYTFLLPENSNTKILTTQRNNGDLSEGLLTVSDSEASSVLWAGKE